jgi:hypothetical protein
VIGIRTALAVAAPAADPPAFVGKGLSHDLLAAAVCA